MIRMLFCRLERAMALWYCQNHGRMLPSFTRDVMRGWDALQAAMLHRHALSHTQGGIH
jgi:hypothetical protein